MTELFAADVSKYQRPVTNSYPRQWLIFRAGDGSVDPVAKQNLAWCKKALASGKLLGYTAYIVYRPGMQPTKILNDLGYPTNRHVMIDCESWGGQIGGNRSTELNAIATAIRKRQGGNSHLVWGYGNQGDLAGLWPTRLSWMRIVVAGYSSSKPGLANMVGWQYTDGETKWAVPSGWPRSSAPFGACDHNRLYLSAQDLGDDDVSQADVIAALQSAAGQKLLKQASADGVWGQEAPDVSGKHKYKMWRFITGNNDWAVKIAQAAAGTSQIVADVVARVAALQSVQAAQGKQISALADLVKTQAAQTAVTGDVKVTLSGEGTAHIGDAK